MNSECKYTFYDLVLPPALFMFSIAQLGGVAGAGTIIFSFFVFQFSHLSTSEL